MANSGTVTAGSAALASQYNNLRDDVLNITTGHTHTGASENGAKVAATGVSSGTAANGAVLTANGSGAAAFLAIGASGGILKYEEFTSSGSFVIPATASSSAAIVLEVIGAGGGGAGGRKNTDGGGAAESEGGGGGAGGGYSLFTYLASTFGTAGGTVTVTIGAGGAGGAGTAANGTNVGTFGGLTSFGSADFVGGRAPTTYSGACARFTGQLFIADAPIPATSYGTAAGSASVEAFSSSGTGAVNLVLNFGGHGGISGDYSTVSGGNGFDSGLGGAGGGAGAGQLGATTKPGGRGGKKFGFVNGEVVSASVPSNQLTRLKFGNGVAAGASNGGAGSAGVAAGDGGSGGGSKQNGDGGAGGAGAAPGGGGGGGGGSTGTGSSGAGGAGAAGRVRVWVIG